MPDIINEEILNKIKEKYNEINRLYISFTVAERELIEENDKDQPLNKCIDQGLEKINELIEIGKQIKEEGDECGRRN